MALYCNTALPQRLLSPISQYAWASICESTQIRHDLSCMNVNSIGVLIWGHQGILCSWENLLQLINLAHAYYGFRKGIQFPAKPMVRLVWNFSGKAGTVLHHYQEDFCIWAAFTTLSSEKLVQILLCRFGFKIFSNIIPSW